MAVIVSRFSEGDFINVISKMYEKSRQVVTLNWINIDTMIEMDKKCIGVHAKGLGRQSGRVGTAQK